MSRTTRRLLFTWLTRRNFMAVGMLLVVLLSAALISPAHAQQNNPCDQSTNPVVAENCQPGADDWLIQHDLSDIEGYASAGSVNHGEPIEFFVNTSAPRFNINIYRTGYYGGKGARLIQSINDVQGRSQPDCYFDPITGLTSCANWSSSYKLDVPKEWVSGVYIAKLIRPDTGGESYIFFIVRDDERKSDILYQSSTTTFQAYNIYGGKSVYKSGARNACPTIAESTRAVKVSFNRPYQARLFGDNYNIYSHGEFAMVYWLESQGYDVTYSANQDTHRSGTPGQPNRLLDHKTFLVVGHDEYWSQEMRDAVTQARDAGVNIAFFSSNVAYWRIRFEPDPITGEPDKTMVVYKTTESGPVDPSGTPTGTWRDPTGANEPENSLIGTQYIGDNNARSFPLRVSAEYKKDRLYRHTGIQDIPDGSYVNIGKRLIGWEWDAVTDNGKSPDGLEILASTPTNGEILKDAGREYAPIQPAVMNVTRYTAPSGAIVFAASTNRWTLGLSDFAATGWFEANPLVKQMTYNLLADMNVQPATPSPELVLDTDTSGRKIPVEDGGQLFRDDEAPTIIVSDIRTNTSDTSATIEWKTSTETNGQIWIDTVQGQVNNWSTNILEDYSTDHSLTIGGMEPNTTYYFHIVSSDPGEDTVISDEQSLKTAQTSFTQRVKLAVEPVYYPVRCWTIQNRPIAIGLAVACGVIVVLGLGWLGWMLRRRRKTQTA